MKELKIFYINVIIAYLLDAARIKKADGKTKYAVMDFPEKLTCPNVNLMKALNKVDITEWVKALPDIESIPEELPEVKINIKNFEDAFIAGKEVRAFVAIDDTAEICNPIVMRNGYSGPAPPPFTERTHYFKGSGEDLKNAWIAILKRFKKMLSKIRSSIGQTVVDVTKISKIARHAIQSGMTIIKPLFSKKFRELPQMAKILQAAADKLQRKLTLAEIFEVLTAAGEYLHGSYICRTVENKTIRFNFKSYVDHISAKKIISSCAGDEAEIIDAGMKRIKLNALSHKIAHIILHELYIQRKFNGLGVVLTKAKMIEYLGYHSGSTEIYRDIDEAIDALYFLEFVIYHYKAGGESNHNRQIKEELGRFITEKSQDNKKYILNISAKFIGCIVNTGKKGPDLFVEGYFSWTPIILNALRHSSTADYLLAQLLISSKGNAALKVPGMKVIAHKTETLINILKIEYNQTSKAIGQLIQSISNLVNSGIIARVDPDLKRLSQIQPRKLKGQTIKIYVKRNLKDVISDMFQNPKAK
ncbi:MAG: hypothetical protein BWY32_01875 [bacterium ADurb.Bin243]|nr:MAG: hypothetical protein BWY32_01875 [bacterium ADurb.Bin243]HOD41741.1 hypothetical protein [Candidatus Wallbacteria bacterium]